LNEILGVQYTKTGKKRRVEKIEPKNLSMIVVR